MARQHPNHDKVKAIVDGVVTSHPRIKAYLRQSKPANCPFPHFIQPSYGKGEGDPQKVGIAYIICNAPGGRHCQTGRSRRSKEQLTDDERQDLFSKLLDAGCEDYVFGASNATTPAKQGKRNSAAHSLSTQSNKSPILIQWEGMEPSLKHRCESAEESLQRTEKALRDVKASKADIDIQLLSAKQKLRKAKEIRKKLKEQLDHCVRQQRRNTEDMEEERIREGSLRMDIDNSNKMVDRRQSSVNKWATELAFLNREAKGLAREKVEAKEAISKANKTFRIWKREVDRMRKSPAYDIDLTVFPDLGEIFSLDITEAPNSSQTVVETPASDDEPSKKRKRSPDDSETTVKRARKN